MTLTSASYVTDRNGNPNSALQFNYGYASVGNSFTLTGTPMTMAFWWYQNAGSGFSNSFTLFDCGTASKNQFQFYQSNRYTWALTLYSAKIATNSPYTFTFRDTVQDYWVQSWTHVALSLSASIKIYYNASLHNTNASYYGANVIPYIAFSSAPTCYMGTTLTKVSALNGIYDDFFVFGRELTGTEVIQV